MLQKIFGNQAAIRNAGVDDAKTGFDAGTAASREARDARTTGINNKAGELRMELDKNREARDADQTAYDTKRRPVRERAENFDAAERLLIAKRRSLGLDKEAEIGEDRSAAEQEMQDFQTRVYDTYGLNPDGKGDKQSFSKTNPAKITTQQEFDKLPAGTHFINPADGKLMIKR
jgi:hypothetical protein